MEKPPVKRRRFNGFIKEKKSVGLGNKHAILILGIAGEVPLNFRSTELSMGSYHGLSQHSKAEGLPTQLQVVEKYLMTLFARPFKKLKEAG